MSNQTDSTYNSLTGNLPPLISRTPIISKDISGTPEGKINSEGDIGSLMDLRNKYPNNPCIGYLNINSLRGDKFTHVRELCRLSPLDILCIDETKLTPDFPDAQFSINGYQHPPFRRDRVNTNSNSFGGGKLVFIKEGLICKRLETFETKTAETICIELTISKKKWFVMFAYRPESINRALFFEELNQSLSNAVNTYDNIVLAGDLNIDTNSATDDTRGYLSDICDTFGLHNLINVETCTMGQNGSSLDIILTNKRACFQKTSVIETGLSDFHKLVCTFLRCHFQRIPPKIILYRNYKNMNYEKFMEDVKSLPYNNLHRFSNPFLGLTTLFKSIVDRHAPLKTKKLRGNQVPYMTKELSKSIMHRSKLRNKYNRWKSRENYVALQQAKKRCKFLSRIAKK